MSKDGIVHSITTSIVTGIGVAIPAVYGFGVKVFTVFFLAFVAELGRRVVTRLWRQP